MANTLPTKIGTCFRRIISGTVFYTEICFKMNTFVLKRLLLINIRTRTIRWNVFHTVHQSIAQKPGLQIAGNIGTGSVAADVS